MGVVTFKISNVERTIGVAMEAAEQEPMTASYKSAGVAVTTTVIKHDDENDDQAAKRLGIKIEALKKVFTPDPI